MSDNTDGLWEEVCAFIKAGKFRQECIALRGLSAEDREEVLAYPNSALSLREKSRKWERWIWVLAGTGILAMIFLPGNYKFLPLLLLFPAGGISFYLNCLEDQIKSLWDDLNWITVFADCSSLFRHLNKPANELGDIAEEDEVVEIHEQVDRIMVSVCAAVLRAKNGFGIAMKNGVQDIEEGANRDTVHDAVGEVWNDRKQAIEDEDRLLALFQRLKLLRHREFWYFDKAEQLLAVDADFNS